MLTPRNVSFARCLGALTAVALGGCIENPAVRSPLRQELEHPDSGTVVQATTACLDRSGWSVGQVRDGDAGERVVEASLVHAALGVGAGVNSRGQGGPAYSIDVRNELVDLVVFPPETIPRIACRPRTIGEAMCRPDLLEEFWTCMRWQLEGPSHATP
jgi:hypothetical protein